MLQKQKDRRCGTVSGLERKGIAAPDQAPDLNQSRQEKAVAGSGRTCAISAAEAAEPTCGAREKRVSDSGSLDCCDPLGNTMSGPPPGASHGLAIPGKLGCDSAYR